ncbi:ABA4-like family protein [Eudoraea chungangensis]|uniref:ABA4-like family protein n=1 Tax=Eudoraea chungangensis TaxID=1481905 RepID=UPI0023EDB7BC|nr:ABA4-like family protein [Eudoraea chungangensis]
MTITIAELFSLTNMIAMLMWVLMIGLPKWKITRFLMTYKIVPIFLSFFYVYFMVSHLLAGGGLDFGNLGSVMALFTFENALMAGWIHYLAFDLLIGIWMIKENEQLGIHPFLMAPCLFGTFMLGPVGFLLFMLIRTIKLSK